jgi:hypothetical protein
MMNNRWLSVAVLVLLVLVSAVVLRSTLDKSVSANGPQPPTPWLMANGPQPPTPWLNGPQPPTPWKNGPQPPTPWKQ